MKAVVIAFLALQGCVPIARFRAPQPNLGSHYGCTVQPVDNASTTFQATGWTGHGETRDWKTVLSRRIGRHARRKCLNDCDDFMESVNKK